MSDKIQVELEQIIKDDNDGLLKVHAIVKFAEDPETALHSRFIWDDSKAARAYRLVQAGAVVRLYIDVIHEDKPATRVFVSLPEDRAAGGGYRYIMDVLTDEQRRAQLITQALDDFRFLRKKYQNLKELAEIYKAIDETEVLPIMESPKELVVVEA